MSTYVIVTMKTTVVSGNRLFHPTRGWHFRLLGLGRFETFDFPVKDENY